jgi:hypothetical protein
MQRHGIATFADDRIDDVPVPRPSVVAVVPRPIRYTWPCKWCGPED